jgi:L-amino acid N-acyltransferase YncA
VRSIRLATPEDAGPMAEIYAPFVTGSAISFEAEPPSETEMARRLAAGEDHAPWLVCAEERRVLGFAYASRHRDRAAYRWSVDVSVYVDQAAHRRGLGRALYTSLFALLRGQGFHAAHAGITLPNPASVGLHESLGFVPVGVYRSVGFKLGAWRDVGWWQLELRPRVGQPAPPLSTTEAKATTGWAGALAAGEPLLRS